MTVNDNVKMRWTIARIAFWSFVWLFLLFLVVVLLSPEPPRFGEKHRRRSCSMQLQGIALALLEYKKANGCFPPSQVKDEASGQIHSWRVALLPYPYVEFGHSGNDLSDQELYAAYEFCEPWDSPANRRARRERPSPYFCPSNLDGADRCTNYVMVVGRSRNDAAKEEGDSPETIIVVEVKNSGIHWAEPSDMHLEEMSFQINDPSAPSISSHHPGGAHFLRVDASGDYSIEFLEDESSPEKVRKLLENNEGARLF